MQPTADRATDALIELRRWAIEQAVAVVGRGGTADDVVYAAERLEDWVLQDGEVVEETT